MPRAQDALERPTYSPCSSCQSGLRRSRNADNPSRPSGLTRKRASSWAVSLREHIAVAELRHAAHELFRGAQSFGSAAQEVIDLRLDHRVELLCSRRKVQQTDAACFGCLERRGGQEQTPCMSIADRRDDIGRDDRRHDAEPHLRQCELRSLHADRDVCARDQADAAAEHIAVDTCNHRLVELVERAQAASQQEGVGDVLLLRCAHHRTHVSDVSARTEARTCTGYYDDPHACISGQRHERGV